MPRAIAYHSQPTIEVTSKSGRPESCTIPTSLTPDARTITPGADSKSTAPSYDILGKHLVLHDDGALQATEAPSPNRRTLLAGLAGAAATLAVIAPTAAAAAESPDSELLDLLAQFDALEREIYPAGPGAQTIQAEDERDLAMAPLRARQEALLGRICTMRATTAAGWQARARSYVLWDDEMRKAIAAGDDPAAYDEDRMIAALIRDMTAGEV
jgi:hypothetical protein